MITTEVDTTALYDLRLFIDNEATLHTNRVVPMIKNVARKLKNGTYDHQLAPKLWMYLVQAGIELYIKDCGGTKTWHSWMMLENTQNLRVSNMLLSDYIISAAIKYQQKSAKYMLADEYIFELDMEVKAAFNTLCEVAQLADAPSQFELNCQALATPEDCY